MKTFPQITIGDRVEAVIEFTSAHGKPITGVVEELKNFPKLSTPYDIEAVIKLDKKLDNGRTKRIAVSIKKLQLIKEPCFICKEFVQNKGFLTKAQKDDLILEILHKIYHKI